MFTERYEAQMPGLFKYLVLMSNAPYELQSHVCLNFSHKTPYDKVREAVMNYMQASTALRANYQGAMPMDVDAIGKGKGKGQGKSNGKSKGKGKEEGSAQDRSGGSGQTQVTCDRCGQVGHKSPECPQKKKAKGEGKGKGKPRGKRRSRSQL